MKPKLDASLFYFIYGRFQGPRWHSLFEWVTRLGDFSVVTAVALWGAAEALWARRGAEKRPPVLSWLGTPLACELTTRLKELFGRLRPFEVYSLGVHPGDLGRAFPSGHTTAAFALAAALGYRWPRGRVLWFGLAAGVGLSRIALGLHWPSDVAAGAAVGFFVVFGFVKLEQNLKRKERGG